jgi:hypothetical protein
MSLSLCVLLHCISKRPSYKTVYFLLIILFLSGLLFYKLKLLMARYAHLNYQKSIIVDQEHMLIKSNEKWQFLESFIL